MKNRLITKVLTGVGIVAALAVLYVVSPLTKNQAHAENGRIVTIYHDGQQQVIATNAETVGEALDRAGVKVEQNDAVEPAQNIKLVAQSYDVNVYRARPVTVVDGAERYRIMSPYQSAKKIAEAAGLQVYDEDILAITRIDDFVAQGGAGLMLTITRSTPLHLVLYGKAVDIRTQAKTVGELLKEKGITLGAKDDISPAAATPITANMTLDVYRDGEQTASEEKEIDFTTKQVQDADQPVGYKKIDTPGVKGKKIVTYQIELKNGKEVSRKEIQSVTTVEPKQQVEIIGTKVNLPAGSHQDWMSAAGIAASDYGYVDYIISHESGWRYNAQGYGTTYGLCQAYPGTKMSSAGADWQTNPITQLKWCSGYAVSRYGSWAAAYQHWTVSHNW
jgi:uncharacterized protein YabE (DUF348 family)